MCVRAHVGNQITDRARAGTRQYASRKPKQTKTLREVSRRGEGVGSDADHERQRAHIMSINRMRRIKARRHRADASRGLVSVSGGPHPRKRANRRRNSARSTRDDLAEGLRSSVPRYCDKSRASPGTLARQPSRATGITRSSPDRKASQWVGKISQRTYVGKSERS